MRFPGFIGPTYTLQSVNVDCQRCVNWYPEMNDLGTGKEKEVAFLAPTPGLRLFATLGESPVRGIWQTSKGTVFAVGGSQLYMVTSDGMAVPLGTLNTSTGPVSIADNGIQLFVVDGTYGYVLTLETNVFFLVTDPDFPGADQVAFLDGYFIFNYPDTGKFFFSGLNDITFDGVDISTAESSPDILVGLISSNQNIALFGSQSVEIFYDSGDADSPFQRVSGAVIEVGCAAPFSIAKLSGGGIMWLGGDSTGQGIVYKMQGYQAQRVSNSSVEAVIRSCTPTQIAAARAWVYQQSGHVFYVLNIPGLKSTWVHDMTTGLWHERTYLADKEEQRHLADCHAVGFGLSLVGDYKSGNIYVLDQDALTDNGTSIARTRAAPHITKELKRIAHSAFQLDMETGVGLDGIANGTNPQAMIQWSDDGGHTWSNEHWAFIGKIGKTKTRVIWRRLGTSRDRVYRVKVTDPVKAVLIGADLMMEEGAT